MRIATVLQIGSALCGLAVASPAIAGSDKFETIYTFGSVPNDGAFPAAPLISLKGMLYGTTERGGTNNGGTVYAIDPVTGKETIVSNAVGGESHEPVTFYKGNFYGTTSNTSIIFSLNRKTKHVTNLHNFPDGGDDEPAQPNGLTEFRGTLFGTTLGGGPRGCGYVFGFDPVGEVLSKLHTFTCGVGGGYPIGDLVVQKGLLYGVTQQGGADQSGTIFSVDPTSGAKKTLQSLDCASKGCFPSGVTFYKGVMFGSTWFGGASASGTLFTFDPASRKYTIFLPFLAALEGVSLLEHQSSITESCTVWGSDAPIQISMAFFTKSP